LEKDEDKRRRRRRRWQWGEERWGIDWAQAGDDMSNPRISINTSGKSVSFF
jgi:hypothetical protein